jgi:hypothetical protein
VRALGSARGRLDIARDKLTPLTKEKGRLKWDGLDHGGRRQWAAFRSRRHLHQTTISTSIATARA